jgi:hypothetical protein
MQYTCLRGIRFVYASLTNSPSYAISSAPVAAGRIERCGPLGSGVAAGIVTGLLDSSLLSASDRSSSMTLSSSSGISSKPCFRLVRNSFSLSSDFLRIRGDWPALFCCEIKFLRPFSDLKMAFSRAR